MKKEIIVKNFFGKRSSCSGFQNELFKDINGMKRIKRVLNVLCEKKKQQQQKLLVMKNVLDPSRDSTSCACPLLKLQQWQRNFKSISGALHCR